MLGYAPEALENSFETFARLVHPDDMPRINAAIEAYLGGQSDRYSVPIRILQADGTYTSIVTEALLEHNEAGAPVFLYGSHRFPKYASEKVGKASREEGA
jgi:hypothetical protein